jgi:hypothetical protein
MSDNWIQRSFDAARFTASGAMTWTVDAGDVVTDAYIVLGKTVIYSLTLANSTTGGTASTELRVTLPSTFSVMRTMDSMVRIFDGTSGLAAYAHVVPGVTYIRFTLLNPNNLPLVTNGIGIQGQIIFEIE